MNVAAWGRRIEASCPDCGYGIAGIVRNTDDEWQVQCEDCSIEFYAPYSSEELCSARIDISDSGPDPVCNLPLGHQGGCHI